MGISFPRIHDLRSQRSSRRLARDLYSNDSIGTLAHWAAVRCDFWRNFWRCNVRLPLYSYEVNPLALVAALFDLGGPGSLYRSYLTINAAGPKTPYAFFSSASYRRRKVIRIRNANAAPATRSTT